jgi:hypothetical protein
MANLKVFTENEVIVDIPEDELIEVMNLQGFVYDGDGDVVTALDKIMRWIREKVTE